MPSFLWFYFNCPLCNQRQPLLADLLDFLAFIIILKILRGRAAAYHASSEFSKTLHEFNLFYFHISILMILIG